MTVATRAMAERKTFGHRSWRVARGDAPPALEPAEHDLDAIAALVAALVVFHGLLARLPAWDAGFYPSVLQCFSKPVGIMAPIRQKPLGLRQAVQKRRCAGIITDLSCRHEEANGPTFRIGDGVQLRVHAAFRSTDLASAPPFLTPMLVAVRWGSDTCAGSLERMAFACSHRS